MGLLSLRILDEAGFSGVFFAAKILRCELPRYRLPLPEFASNVIPCSAPLKGTLQLKSYFQGTSCERAFLKVYSTCLAISCEWKVSSNAVI